MKKIILILLFFSISYVSKINATVQLSNKLIFQEQEYYVQFFPLEHFFENNPDKRLNSEYWNTGLSRGYIATFEIIDNQLFVINIEILEHNEFKKECYPYDLVSVYDKIFPDSKRTIIEWPTNVIIIPKGEQIDYIQDLDLSIYPNYLVLEICEGKLESSTNYKLIEFVKFINIQFELHSKTKEYSKILSNYTNGENSLSEEVFVSYFKSRIFKFVNEILHE